VVPPAYHTSQSSLTIKSCLREKIFFYKNPKLTGQSEYGRKLQSMIKMFFFQQKIPEKKPPVHYIENNNIYFLPVEILTMEERNNLQVKKRWAEILDDRSYKSI